MATTSIHSINASQVRALAYIVNESKTQNGKYVESFMCSSDPDVATKDFESVQQSGTGRSRILAQHIIQSFKPGEVTAEQALEVGKQLAEKMLKGQYQYLLAVHTDKKHIHCHIVFNNTNFYNGKSFETLENRRGKSWENLRKISDDLCLEHGISVIENAEKSKGKSHYEWDMNRQGLSWKSKLKFAIDECIMESDNFNDFLEKLKEKNIEAVYNPQHKINLKFRMEGQTKYTRAKTLGWYYESTQIKKRISDYNLLKTGRLSSYKKAPIIDTSLEKFKASVGLERWAEIQNMKEMSKLLNIITEYSVESMNDLENKSVSAYSDRMKIVSDLNNIQHEIDSISDTLKDIRTYKKYRPVFDEMKKKTGFTKKNFEKKYQSELSKFNDSREHLSKRFPDKKIPSEESLTERKNELSQQRNDLNEEYKKTVKTLENLDNARNSLEQYLNQERDKSKKIGSDLE